MQKYADYIRRIEIDSLWSGKKHVVWELNRQVNILSGINGVGKSTILNKIIKSVNTNGDIINHLLKGVHIDVEPADATHIRFDIIRSLDSPMLDNETLNMVDTRIRSAWACRCRPAAVGEEEPLPGHRRRPVHGYRQEDRQDGERDTVLADR